MISKQYQVVENMVTEYQMLNEGQILKEHWVFSKG